jgi:hypothetical protein
METLAEHSYLTEYEMDTEILKKAIMNITGELDKLSAFLHLDRKELNPEEETEEKDPLAAMLSGEEEEPTEELPMEEAEEPEEVEEEGKKPMKIDFLAIKKGKKGAFG